VVLDVKMDVFNVTAFEEILSYISSSIDNMSDFILI
jgi:hypothetical protein